MNLLDDVSKYVQERPMADDAEALVGVRVWGDGVGLGHVLIDGVAEGESGHKHLGAVPLCWGREGERERGWV